MESLVNAGHYGYMNKTYTTTIGYYVIKIVSEVYNLQEYTACERQISKAGELVVKAQYSICMQENTKWYWYQKHQQKIIIVPTITILNPFIYVVAVKDVHNIHRSVCDKNQENSVYKVILYA